LPVVLAYIPKLQALQLVTFDRPVTLLYVPAGQPIMLPLPGQ
jgi:hypothetical protein